jgi:thiol-disulfide isomerase/thioredoxin
MSLMRLKLTKPLIALLGLIATQIAIGQENDFQYFSKSIDFWGEKAEPPPIEKATATTETKPEKPLAPKIEEAKKESFEWGTYMDPKNKEFFKEGDYTPPEPFMELVRNPTDENMKMWFAYMDKKNELQTRLQQKMAEYMAKNGQSVPQPDEARVAALAPAKLKNVDPQRYRLRMYFNSTCPHCQRMFGTLSELQAKGFFVEARQLDRDHGAVRALPFPAEFASPDEVKQKNIQSVPLLLIGDLKKKVVYRLNGFQPTTEVLKAIQGQDGGM